MNLEWKNYWKICEIVVFDKKLYYNMTDEVNGMDRKNMCKFVFASSGDIVKTISFVYESLVPHSGEMQLLSNHAIYLVMQGEGEYSNEYLKKRLKVGMLFFSFAGIPFRIDDTGDLQYMFITFTGERANELFKRFGVTPKNCIFEGFGALGPLWKESLTCAGGENIDLLSESMLLYAFSKLRNSVNPCNQLLNQMLKIIEQQFADCNFTLSSMAEAIGYNAKYLSCLFRKEMGSGFSDYLTTVRIKHAVFLMEHGVTTAKNVALLSGYSDPLYFSKVFKKQMGVSPREYLNLLQKNKDLAE